MPDPAIADLSNWRHSPFNRWGFQHVAEIIPTAKVAAGGDRLPLPASTASLDGLAVTGLDGAPMSLEAALAATATDGIVVLKDGAVVFESYANGMTADQPHILMSATKAVTGLLAGVLSDKGLLEIDAPVTTYVPEVAAGAFDGATLRHLIDMRTGVRLDAEQQRIYAAASNWDPVTPEEAGANLHDFIALLPPMALPHGGPFAYISCNTDLMGWAIERATGTTYAEALSTHLWAPMGAEHDASITLDRAGSPRPTGGLSATVRDFARLGQTVLEGGRGVAPAAWIEDICTGGDHAAWVNGEWGQIFGFAGTDMRYRAGWYIVDGAPAHIFAMGIHGQNLFIDRARGVVIAKVSSLGNPIDYAAHPLIHRLARSVMDGLG